MFQPFNPKSADIPGYTPSIFLFEDNMLPDSQKWRNEALVFSFLLVEPPARFVGTAITCDR
jgi:hypothetical protein